MLEIYDLIRKAKKYDYIIIFGFSPMGKEVYQEFNRSGLKCNIYFCDNDEKKQDHKEVFSVADAVKKYADALFVTVSFYHYQSMKEQLYEEGVEDNNIENYMPYGYRVRNDMEKMFRRITPLPELQFEVDLANHCNLNCKFCDHFSPLAEKRYPKFEQFEKDMNRLSFLFKGHAKRIFLLGGEPLLNSSIHKYMKCVRDAFPIADILVYTNGLLLEKMGREFWEECKRSAIRIAITKYPISENVYQKMEEKCNHEQADWEYVGNTSICKYSYHYPLDLDGKQDARDMFLHCNNANECITLKEGKLYTCSVAPNIENFNKYFQQNIELNQDDGIDIYEANTAREILTFLSCPISFCRYCKVHERTYDHKWGISNKEISEWT